MFHFLPPNCVGSSTSQQIKIFKEEIYQMITYPINQDYDNSEKFTRCRLCGYKITNQEIAYYSNYCVFCSDESPYSKHSIEQGSWKISIMGASCVSYQKRPTISIIKLAYWWVFCFYDMRIHLLKIKLRDIVYKSLITTSMTNHLDFLTKMHDREIHHAPYSDIKNKYESEYLDLKERLVDLRNEPRFAYLDALSIFCFDSDTAPATRDLSRQQKKRLSKIISIGIKLGLES